MGLLLFLAAITRRRGLAFDPVGDEEGPPVTYEEDEAPPLDEDLPPPEHPRR